MRTILGVLILASALALNIATAFGANADRPFIGDGFDNTTCADVPRGETCHR